MNIVVVVRSKAINHLHLAVVVMSTVGLSSLFSFILRTRLAYDVSTNLELASEHADVRPVSYDVRHTEQRSGLSYAHIKVSD